MSHDTYDREKQIGELLDRALREEQALYFQPAWHPKYRAQRAKQRSWRIALGSAAVLAMGLAALPLTVQLPQAHGSVSNLNLAAIHLPKGLTRQLSLASDNSYSVSSMTPVYGSYPIASPTGHNLMVNGNFSLSSASGNSLSLLLNNRMQVEGGMLFSHGAPVYSFEGSSLAEGTVIAPSASATPVTGTWYQRGDSDINTVSAAGSHVYVTRGNTWADLMGYGKYYWISSPGSPPSTTLDTIAGLPSNPNHALLVEESPSGASHGYLTSNGGHTWRTWSLGAQSVTNLIAIGNRYWAILNGTLAWSDNGRHWTTALPLNVNKWQVETYAVDPANPEVISVALIPISGDGVGPILETQDGGTKWSEVPNFPAIGAAPSTMVMTQNGDIAALINLDGPVIIRYNAQTQHWTTFSVPATKNSLGLGQLAASPNGDLLYASPGGLIYQWIRQSHQWLSISPQSDMDATGSAANILEAIGNNQVLAGYPGGWFIFYESPAQIQTQGLIAPAGTTNGNKANSREDVATR